MSKNKLLGDLFKRFFCSSRWLAFAGVAIYQPRPLQVQIWADLIVAAFAIVTIATLSSGLMFGAFFTAGSFMRSVSACSKALLTANRELCPMSWRALCGQFQGCYVMTNTGFP